MPVFAAEVALDDAAVTLRGFAAGVAEDRVTLVVLDLGKVGKFIVTGAVPATTERSSQLVKGSPKEGRQKRKETNLVDLVAWLSMKAPSFAVPTPSK